MWADGLHYFEEIRHGIAQPNKGLEESVYPAAYIPYSMSPFDGFDVVLRTLGDPARLTRTINQDFLPLYQRLSRSNGGHAGRRDLASAGGRDRRDGQWYFPERSIPV